MPPSRIVVFRARIECIECAGVVFLDGPVRSAQCSTCDTRNEIKADWWSVIERADVDYDELPESGMKTGTVSSGITMLYSRGRATAVLCSTCEQPVDLSTFQWHQAAGIHCPSCTTETTATPTPDWLREHAGRCHYIFGALSEETALEVSAYDQNAKPVSMACLNCGASLTISECQSRVTQCDFCSCDYYIPDAIWFRFHKKRRRRSWFAVYWDAQQTS